MRRGAQRNAGFLPGDHKNPVHGSRPGRPNYDLIIAYKSVLSRKLDIGSAQCRRALNPMLFT